MTVCPFCLGEKTISNIGSGGCLGHTHWCYLQHSQTTHTHTLYRYAEERQQKLRTLNRLTPRSRFADRNAGILRGHYQHGPTGQETSRFLARRLPEIDSI